jgi:hypothetical protein
MKSARSDDAGIDAFWAWFGGVAGRLGARLDDEEMLAELDRRVRELSADVSWEVGPGLSKPSQLVVSPNLDREVRPLARRIVARAPVRADWEFHAARQPRDWDYRFQLRDDSGEGPMLDASNWTFVLLRYPDGAHEVLLHPPEPAPLSDDQRWEAAAIVLESILGEDVVLDRVDDFELVDEWEPSMAGKARPIQQLREAVTGPSGPAVTPGKEDGR